MKNTMTIPKRLYWGTNTTYFLNNLNHQEAFNITAMEFTSNLVLALGYSAQRARQYHDSPLLLALLEPGEFELKKTGGEVYNVKGISKIKFPNKNTVIINEGIFYYKGFRMDKLCTEKIGYVHEDSGYEPKRCMEILDSFFKKFREKP